MSITADKRHILAVNDSQTTLDGVRRILEVFSYRVSTAPNGTTALDIVRRDEPDVVLLGIAMPGMNGREVCRKMREMSNKVRIIYWSGYVDRADVMTFAQLRREADDVMGKSVSDKEILVKIARVLNVFDQARILKPCNAMDLLNVESDSEAPETACMLENIDVI